MADGGEGTLDAILHASGSGATRERIAVPGAAGAEVDAAFGLIDASPDRVGVIEIAQVVGITDAVAMKVDAGERSTTGVGVLMRALLDRGVRDFRIGLGGSSTNDGGAGFLAALGVTLTDARGVAVEPTPRGLQRLAAVSTSGLDARLAGSRITILSDVDNPLCGPGGAIAVFGPQKGVAADLVATFDGTLARYAALAERAFSSWAAGSSVSGRAVAQRPGAGAAGGLGFALQLHRRSACVRGGRRRRPREARCRASATPRGRSRAKGAATDRRCTRKRPTSWHSARIAAAYRCRSSPARSIPPRYRR